MDETQTKIETKNPVINTNVKTIVDEENQENPKLFTDDDMKIDVEVDSVTSPLSISASEFKYRKPYNTIPYKLSESSLKPEKEKTPEKETPKKETTEDIINKAINYVETFNGVNKKNTRIIFCVLLAALLIRLFCI